MIAYSVTFPLGNVLQEATSLKFLALDVKNYISIIFRPGLNVSIANPLKVSKSPT